MNEKILEDLLITFKSSQPNIPIESIDDIVKTSCECTNYDKVIFLLEKYNALLWPKCRPFIITIIDGICKCCEQSKREKMIKAISFRLLEIMIKVSQCRDDQKLEILQVIQLWKEHNVFELNLCEEIEYLLNKSMFPSDGKITVIDSNDIQIVNNYEMANNELKQKEITIIEDDQKDMNPIEIIEIDDSVDEHDKYQFFLLLKYF